MTLSFPFSRDGCVAYWVISISHVSPSASHKRLVGLRSGLTGTLLQLAEVAVLFWISRQLCPRTWARYYLAVDNVGLIALCISVVNGEGAVSET